jgi:hypothetical protein
MLIKALRAAGREYHLVDRDPVDDRERDLPALALGRQSLAWRVTSLAQLCLPDATRPQ